MRDNKLRYIWRLSLVPPTLFDATGFRRLKSHDLYHLEEDGISP